MLKFKKLHLQAVILKICSTHVGVAFKLVIDIKSSYYNNVIFEYMIITALIIRWAIIFEYIMIYAVHNLNKLHYLC